MRDEWHYCEGNIRESAESDDCEGEICNDMVPAKRKDDESCKEQEYGKKEKERQHLDEPEDAEPTCASRKVLVYTGMVKGCIFALNYLEVSASPLLQKCGHERACETEHETEEPDCVDEYDRRGR